MRLYSPEKLDGLSVYQIFPRQASKKGDLDSAALLLPGVAALGFDIVYLTPVHPIGKRNRKGSIGSPYAIADYREVDPRLGGEPALKRFFDTAHELGLKVLMDVVFNHTSPDARLVGEHPEWFWKDAQGEPGPRVADWADVADLDHSAPGLAEYLIEALLKWINLGADGFRCDVASLVPVEFWIEARRRVEAIKPSLWIAESVHPAFLVQMRRAGFSAWSDSELHRAFDLSYDYDGREIIEETWKGKLSLDAYLRHLALQEAILPAGAAKLRFLENHDQERAAGRFGRGARLRNWSLFAMLLPGAFMAYMGEEFAIEKKPNLFEFDPVDWDSGDEAFFAFFKRALTVAKSIKAEAPLFSVQTLTEGVVLIERRGKGSAYAAILNLDGRSGFIRLAQPIVGGVIAKAWGQAGEAAEKEDKIVIELFELRKEPLVIRLENRS